MVSVGTNDSRRATANRRVGAVCYSERAYKQMGLAHDGRATRAVTVRLRCEVRRLKEWGLVRGKTTIAASFPHRAAARGRGRDAWGERRKERAHLSGFAVLASSWVCRGRRLESAGGRLPLAAAGLAVPFYRNHAGDGLESEQRGTFRHSQRNARANRAAHLDGEQRRPLARRGGIPTTPSSPRGRTRRGARASTLNRSPAVRRPPDVPPNLLPCKCRRPS